MTTNQVLIVVGVLALSEFVIVPTIIRAVIESNWTPISDAFPLAAAPAPRPDAVRREFCSLKIGMLSLGWSVHLTVDEAYLRFEPAMIGRVLGMKPAAAPWSEVKHLGNRGRHAALVSVRGTEILGPRDIFEIARQGAAPAA